MIWHTQKLRNSDQCIQYCSLIANFPGKKITASEYNFHEVSRRNLFDQQMQMSPENYGIYL